MSNMSYCRFENTSRDLDDCYEKMNEGVDIEELSSEYEQKGYKKLIELCCDIALEYGDEVGRTLEEE